MWITTDHLCDRLARSLVAHTVGAMAGASGSTHRSRGRTLGLVERGVILIVWVVVVGGAGFSPPVANAATTEPSAPSPTEPSAPSATDPSAPSTVVRDDPAPQDATGPGDPLFTASVTGDVATGSPPIVPQLASQSAGRAPPTGLTSRSFAASQLPVTGGTPRWLAIGALAIVAAGWLMSFTARRRPA